MPEAVRTLSARECYARIHAFLASAAVGTSRWLPEPERASDSDVDLVLGELVLDGLDAIFPQPDEHGIRLAAYARQGLESRHGGAFLRSDAFRASCRASSLFPKLGRRL